jgi:hypothetical protein
MGLSGKRQGGYLLEIVELKLTSPADRALMKTIREFTGTPDILRADSAIQRLATIGHHRDAFLSDDGTSARKQLL